MLAVIASRLVNRPGSPWTDAGLLVFRVLLGAFMITHGYAKLTSFSEMAPKFFDPFGLGSQASLCLAIFAEFFCSLALILGLLTRFALIPLMVTMLVAAGMVHLSQGFGKMELALLYLVGYVMLMAAGPGRFSVDGLLAAKWGRAEA